MTWVITMHLATNCQMYRNYHNSTKQRQQNEEISSSVVLFLSNEVTSSITGAVLNAFLNIKYASDSAATLHSISQLNHSQNVIVGTICI